MLVGKKLGPFLVDQELGAGAMGSVFRAEHEKTGQVVAIKLISAALAGSENAVARFQREVSILKKLDHPNITKYYGSGRWHNAPFFIMEFIEGESLDHVIERRQRITWEEVVQIGQQLCAALQHAHDQGVIHRDLKPGNLMVLADGTVKLTDFGIAKDTDVTALTAANSTLGTATYMSPEQCKGVRDFTAKSDLYSMGILFYELLTGRRPFNADTVMEMFLLHTTAPFERPSRWVLDIPIWFDTLICELLEKEPERRPENAAAVAKSLNAIKEKMLAQTSAGVDAATKRRGDRSAHDLKLSDIDKDLARALFGKKKKKKSVPFYRQNWFTLSAVLGIAAALLVAVWLTFFKAPGADGLYAEAEGLMKSAMAEPKDYKKAAMGPIAEFLRYHPDHPQAGVVKNWRDKAEAEWCDYQLTNRYTRGFKAEPGAEEAAFKALDDENAGRRAEAEQAWQKLSNLRAETDLEQRQWGLLADKYLREQKAVDDLSRELLKKVFKEKADGKVYEGGDKEEQLALTALRDETEGRRKHEQFETLKKKDSSPDQELTALRDEANTLLQKSRAHWETLREHAARQPELRRWQLLAARNIRDLPK